MADFELTKPDVFPEGTTVKAFLASDWSTLPPSGAPKGSAKDEAEVEEGTASFTGLVQGAAYYAYAEVSGKHRYVGFIAGEDESKAGQDEATQTELDAHAADTTSVHGIVDTAVLATDAELAAHAADTTSVHGIADTAALATKAEVEEGSGGGGGLFPRTLISGRWVTTPGGNLAALMLPEGIEVAFPFEVAEETTFQKIGARITALDTTANVRLGVREDNDGIPGALVAEGAAAIDASAATGEVENETVGFAHTLPAGIYWLTARSSGGNPSVQGTNSLPVIINNTTTAGVMQNIMSGFYRSASSSGALPAEWGATADQQGVVPRVCLQVA